MKVFLDDRSHPASTKIRTDLITPLKSASGRCGYTNVDILYVDVNIDIDVDIDVDVDVDHISTRTFIHVVRILAQN